MYNVSHKIRIPNTWKIILINIVKLEVIPKCLYRYGKGHTSKPEFSGNNEINGNIGINYIILSEISALLISLALAAQKSISKAEQKIEVYIFLRLVIDTVIHTSVLY